MTDTPRPNDDAQRRAADAAAAARRPARDHQGLETPGLKRSPALQRHLGGDAVQRVKDTAGKVGDSLRRTAGAVRDGVQKKGTEALVAGTVTVMALAPSLSKLDDRHGGIWNEAGKAAQGIGRGVERSKKDQAAGEAAADSARAAKARGEQRPK